MSSKHTPKKSRKNSREEAAKKESKKSRETGSVLASSSDSESDRSTRSQKAELRKWDRVKQLIDDGETKEAVRQEMQRLVKEKSSGPTYRRFMKKIHDAFRHKERRDKQAKAQEKRSLRSRKQSPSNSESEDGDIERLGKRKRDTKKEETPTPGS